MGIYSNCSNILLEQKYNAVMSDEQKREVYLSYKELNMTGLSVAIYTECSTTYDKENKEQFMMWYPISFDIFLEEFDV
jgi:hypothetical protein